MTVEGLREAKGNSLDPWERKEWEEWVAVWARRLLSWWWWLQHYHSEFPVKMNDSKSSEYRMYTRCCIYRWLEDQRRSLSRSHDLERRGGIGETRSQPLMPESGL
jgi:hypothetical protein